MKFTIKRTESAFNDLITTHVIKGRESYTPYRFLDAVRPLVLDYLDNHRQHKVRTVLKCLMVHPVDHVVRETRFSSSLKIIDEATNAEVLYDDEIVREIFEKYEECGWLFHSIEHLELCAVKLEGYLGKAFRIAIDSIWKNPFKGFLNF